MVKKIVSGLVLVSSSAAFSMWPATSLADAYAFGTQDVCAVTSCEATPTDVQVAVPSGSTIDEWARTDLKRNPIQRRGSAEIAALEEGPAGKCRPLPSGATAYEWALLGPC